MTIVSQLEKIKLHVYDALDEMATEVENNQIATSPEMYKVMEQSIQIVKFSKTHVAIGLDKGFILSHQFNKKGNVPYYNYYIGGHRESPWLEFTDGTVRKFPAWGGSTYIIDALKDAGDFVDYYKKVGGAVV